MSLLVYGDDSIQMGRILNYNTSSILTPDGIDYICTEHRITFQGVVSFDTGGGSAMVDQAEALIARLRVPRKAFKLYVGTNSDDSEHIILESPETDFRGGPFCDAAFFDKFAGTRTGFVTATFRVHTHSCDDPPAVLTNRWSMTHTLDDAYYTERVVEGELTINPLKVICADDVRESCFRQIPKGMQFVRGTFRQSADGLTLNYSIVVKEQYQLPPNPATSVKAVYREETGMDGAVALATMMVHVEGPKNATKLQLLQVAMKITLARFEFKGAGDDPNKDVFKGGSIEESLHTNQISVMTRAQKTASKPIASSQHRFDPAIFGQPYPDDIAVDSKGDQVPVYGLVTDDQAGIRAVMAAWKDVCSEGESPSQAIPTNSVNGTDGGIPPLAFLYDPPSHGGEIQDKISDQQRANPYDWFEVAVAFRNNTGLTALPLGAQNSDGESVEMVRLQQPSSYRIIRYTARRSGEKPVLPKAKLQDGETELSHDFEWQAPSLSADDFTPVYTVNGTIVIQSHSAVDIDADDLFIGKIPMNQFKVSEEGKVSPGDFDDGLIYPEDD